MRMRPAPGFTLIEILIYTAAVAVVMVGVTLLATAALSVRSQVRASIILEENYRFATNRMVSLINGAVGITEPLTGFTGQEIILIMREPAVNPTVINTQDGVVFVRQGAGQPVALTSEEVDIDSLQFIRASSTIPMVRVVMSGALRDAHPSYPSLTVTTTAVVRQ